MWFLTTLLQTKIIPLLFIMNTKKVFILKSPNSQELIPNSLVNLIGDFNSFPSSFGIWMKFSKSSFGRFLFALKGSRLPIPIR